MGNHLRTYVALIAVELLLTVVVFRRVGGRAGARRLISAGDITAATIARDLGIAAVMWLTWIAFSRVWLTIRPEHMNRDVSLLLPVAAIERAVWIVLSCCAGFAEELTFRGALQRLAERETRSPALAIAVQAVTFGVVHGYQGVGAVLRIIVYGAFFGVVARWRRSLVPGMFAHAWTDIAAGLLRV